MTGDELRRSFLRFFEERGHVELPSLPLIPRDDPSVLFVTAGMQQMIPFFLGVETPPSKRLTSIQKCLRTVDIEGVGDESHLTFFEMMGNFSIGDYYVPEALRFTWEYLTGVLKLPADRLWATIYPGDELARENWLQIGVPVERIVEDPDNWWTRAGLAGPAGPDSEVFFDRGLQYGCAEPDCNPADGRVNCHRFVEIWNNVFMQFLVNEKNEKLRELDFKHIDTGQGFERVLMAVQGVESVYETDVFMPIIDSVAEVIGTPYKTDIAIDRSLRIIADHCRALTMAIADGAVPDNEGRGYVLRRLVRRAALRGRLLGINHPFLAAPIEVTVRLMSGYYPDTGRQRDHILRTIKSEEDLFTETLSRGMPLVENLMGVAEKQSGTVPGDQAFVLHDTYGLPLELIQEVARERNLTVDVAGFDQALREQQERGRAGRTTGKQVDSENLASLSQRLGLSIFTGYTETESDATIAGIIVGGQLADEAASGDSVEIVLDRTPFYAESGGQVADMGTLAGEAWNIGVLDTQRPYGGLIVHSGVVLKGTVTVGDSVRAKIDKSRRADIRPHHSATHILHLALHEILGPEATQAGSLVAPDRLRFDFRWPRQVTDEEIAQIQTRMNELVFSDDPVVTREIPYVDAVAEGAMALFGEKYGDVVRMVTIAESKELCGGTHVSETAEIGSIVILSESGIGSGIRRIEALAGRAAYEHFLRSQDLLKQAAAVLGSAPDRLKERAEALNSQLRAAEKRVAQLSRELVLRQAHEIVAHAQRLDDGDSPARIVVQMVDAGTPEDLRQLAATTAGILGSGVVVMGSVIDNKPQFAAAVTPDLESRGYSARQIAQRVGRSVGGGAGGDARFAIGGGKDASGLESGLREAGEFARATFPPITKA